MREHIERYKTYYCLDAANYILFYNVRSYMFSLVTYLLLVFIHYLRFQVTITSYPHYMEDRRGVEPLLPG